MAWSAIRQVGRFLAVLVLAGFLGATLVRIAPGFDVDERESDVRLSAAAREAIRAEREPERHLTTFYLHYWRGLLHGDLGQSHSLQRPVRDLLRERLPITLRYVALGLLLGWLGGAALALPAAWSRSLVYDTAVTGVTGVLLCLPSALLVLILFLFGLSPALAIALVLLPQVFLYLRGELRRAARAPHLLTAYAKGIPPWRVVCCHVLPAALPATLALAGVSVTIAFGAAIPIESFGDVPGIGQLTWQAALSRDLPLLVNLLLLLTLVTLLANRAAEWAGYWWIRRSR